GVRRREVDRRYVLGNEAVSFGGIEHAVVNEAGERLLIEMLELAPPAAAEVAARRRGVVGSGLERAVSVEQVPRRGERRVAARRGDAIAFCGDADNLLIRTHRHAA